eukprot:523118_1
MDEKHLDLCAHTLNDTIESITIIISSIGLVIISLITYHSLKESTKFNHTLQTDQTILRLYYLCIITTYLVLCLTLIPSILCLTPGHFYWTIIIMDIILFLVAYISLLALLAILIFRLCHTFAFPPYQLSKKEDCLFIALYSITASFALFALIEYIWVRYIYAAGHSDVKETGKELHYHPGYICMFAFFMYILTASYATALFVKKLMNLVAQKEPSTRNLSKTQLIMIDTATKYISVFSLAMVFALLTLVAHVIILWIKQKTNDHGLTHILTQCITLITTICLVINTLCLYLQFSFAAKFYDKYCKKCLECCWKERLTRRARKSAGFKHVPTNTKTNDEINMDVDTCKTPTTLNTLDRKKRCSLITQNSDVNLKAI